MNKLKMQSKSLVDENIEKISSLFPNCVSEGLDESGKLIKVVDFDLLKQELSNVVVEGNEERYVLNWAGKKASMLAANAPIAKTLRPAVKESVGKDGSPEKFDSENLYIEGDNLDVLKLLRETYLGKVKMIYIDPPYNTGNDFIYADDFKTDATEYLQNSSQKDEDGNRLVTNKETNGRFHSDWLSMMYSRLKVTRDLLRDDGVIFISIDDNEVHNLRKICDEVFGAENFVANIIWKKRSTPPNDKVIAAQHEYIICYIKNITFYQMGLKLRSRTEDQISRYKNPDNHPKGNWTSGDLMANVKGGRYVPSLYFPIKNPRTGQEHWPSSNGNWRFNKEKIELLIKNDEIYFGEDDKGRPKLKRFFCDVKEGITWTTIWDFTPYNTEGSKEMTNIFGNLSTFENPKPLGLVLELLKIGLSDNDIILDFFAGSSTTAHAVMQLNAEDGGNRQFIMVQLPEGCNEKSEAFKAGYKNIAEISKERIRRAGKKILEGKCHEDWNQDTGFRVLKVDSSCRNDVFLLPDGTEQRNLATQLLENIKKDRSPEDLLFQILVDRSVELTLPIEKKIIMDKTVFFVDENALIACFDKNISEELIKELAKFQPLRVVFRDSGFASDAIKINAEQIFKQLSPNTEVKSI